MTAAGKDDLFTLDDLLGLAKVVGLKAAKAHAILEAARNSQGQFMGLADKYGLDEDFAAGVYSRFRRL